jgi:hypothetical protein
MTRFVVSGGKRMLVLGLVLGVGAVGCRSRQAAVVEPDREKVIDYEVAAAKRAGKTSVSIQVSNLRPAFQGIKDALNHGGEVLTGVPIQSVVTVSRERTHLRTWYKFRVDEDLTRKADIADSSPVPAEMEVPSALLPLAKDEIVVIGRGGSVMVDGVLVTATVADEPSLEMNHRYLIFVDSARGSSGTPSNKVFWFNLTDDSLFYVGSDNDTVAPVWKAHSLIQNEMKKQFHDSLARLRLVALRQGQ